MSAGRAPGGGGLWRRLPFIALLALGGYLWKGGFGVWATERQLVWRLPVAFAEVQRVELQVWTGEAEGLLLRSERSFDGGLWEELTTPLTTAAGPHRAMAVVQWRDGGAAVFDQSFDPRDQALVTLELRPRPRN